MFGTWSRNKEQINTLEWSRISGTIGVSLVSMLLSVDVYGPC